MWAVLGLCNPGRKYSGTRHNAGLEALKALADKHKIPLKDKGKNFISGRGILGGCEVVLAAPITFMNRSGIAARQIADTLKVKPENIIVMHDDMDIDTGRLKIKKGGSSGGHKGVESIIESLGTKGFIRLKIGIGRDEFASGENYVLGRFKRSEIPPLKEALLKAADAAEKIITEGIEKAMSDYNRKIEAL